MFELRVVGLFGATVHLGHQEDFLPVAIAEGLAHADFADAVVVVPAVVEEGDAFVDGLADELDACLCVGTFADVVTAKADGGDAFAGGAEFAVDHAGGFRAGG